MLSKAEDPRPSRSASSLPCVVAHGAQQHGDRQLALAVDADEDLALLVDLELEPGAAGRHEVRDEDLLLAVLRLHHVGARGAHELRDDHALGAVDDEGAPVGHPREVAHEDRLLADLAGLTVLERDLDGQRARVGDVLLAALGDRGHGLVEDGCPRRRRRGCRCSPRSARRRRSSPGAPLLGVHQPLERAPLDVDEVRELRGRSRDARNCGAWREASARAKTATPSEVYSEAGGRAKARPHKDSTGGAPPQWASERGRHGPRPEAPRYVAERC